MNVRRPMQPPATPAAHRTLRGSCGLRQIDLFDGTRSAEMPTWRELPEETRRMLTALMARLILEHAQISSAASPMEAGHDH